MIAGLATIIPDAGFDPNPTGGILNVNEKGQGGGPLGGDDELVRALKQARLKLEEALKKGGDAVRKANKTLEEAITAAKEELRSPDISKRRADMLRGAIKVAQRGITRLFGAVGVILELALPDAAHAPPNPFPPSSEPLPPPYNGPEEPALRPAGISREPE